MSVETFLPTLRGEIAIPDVSVGEACPGEREVRIQLHRPFKSGPRLICFFFGVAIDEKTALQIGFMRLDVFRAAFFCRANFSLNLCLSCRIRCAAGELSA